MCHGIDLHSIESYLQSFLKIPSILSKNSSSLPVLNSVLSFLRSILFQINVEKSQPLIKKLTSTARSILKKHKKLENCLRLFGTLHYLNPPAIDRSYKKFWSNFIQPLMSKPKNVHYALKYISSCLRPSKKARFNWTAHTVPLVQFFYQNLFSSYLPGNEKDTAWILENLSALDLPYFVNEKIRELLTNDSPYITVTLIVVGQILNPTSGFQELSRSIPTNATVGITKLILNLKDFVNSFVANYFSSIPVVRSNLTFFFLPVSHYLSGIVESTQQKKA